MMRSFAVLAALGLGTAVFAHANATGIVKERMDGMKVISKAMKVVLAETQATTPNADAIKQAARDMEAHAGTAMTRRFPKGSMDHPTEATEAIWQNWDRFEYLAKQLEVKAQGLALAAGNPITGKLAPERDDWVVADFADMGPDAVFTLLGKNCKACHTEFRVKKK